MGKNKNTPGFTEEQRAIFTAITNERYFRDTFYFTGGTALSVFYLQHRYSDDLDFFTQNLLERDKIHSFIYELSKELGILFEEEIREVTSTYYFTFQNKSRLKVDFGYYPYELVQKNRIYEGFEINSERDIATNKMLCIQQRSDVKDFVDFYYLLRKWNIWTISYGFNRKFRQEFHPTLFSSDLLRIDDFTALPRMIKPLTLEELRVFYMDLAREISKDSVE